MTDDISTIEKLLPIWQRKAIALCKKHPINLVAESMVSSAIGGWIDAVGKREVSRSLYLLALQIANEADKEDMAKARPN